MSSPHHLFSIIFISSIIFSMIALYLTTDSSEILAVFKILLPILVSLGAVLYLTRGYWRYSRRLE